MCSLCCGPSAPCIPRGYWDALGWYVTPKPPLSFVVLSFLGKSLMYICILHICTEFWKIFSLVAKSGSFTKEIPWKMSVCLFILGWPGKQNMLEPVRPGDEISMWKLNHNWVSFFPFLLLPLGLSGVWALVHLHFLQTVNPDMGVGILLLCEEQPSCFWPQYRSPLLRWTSWEALSPEALHSSKSS